MYKRLLTTAVTVALLSAGAAWAQTGGNAGVGASVGVGGSSLGASDTARANAKTKKDHDSATMGSSGSAGVGAGSSTGIGAGTNSSTGVGVNPGGVTGNTGTNTGGRVQIR